MFSVESFLLEHPYLALGGWLIACYAIFELLLCLVKEEKDAEKDK